MVTLLWFAPHRAAVSTSKALSPSGISTNQELLDGWRKLEIKDKIAMMLPPDMKSITPIDDSYSYREAYSNRQIDLTIVYGEAIVALRDNQSHFLLPSCETPRLPDKSSYEESFIEIDGRKAKLSIDRSHETEFIGTDVCFAKTADNEVPLRVTAYCKDEGALKTAHRIFSSIRFKG